MTAKSDAPNVFGTPVTTLERLRELVPVPTAKITTAKVQDRIDHHIQTFIGLCPYVVMSTADAAGHADASPRGGPPGFIRVLDDRHILIPELSGNRRADTLRNLLDSNRIGLMFLIPGVEDFLRLNGKAWIVDKPEILASASIMGKSPIVGIGIEIVEAYIHCAKAAKRGTLWNVQEWPDTSALADTATILRDHSRGVVGDGSVDAIQSLLDESYESRLFTPGW